MRVAIVGAGALGSVYGARLARYGGCEVAIVAREAAPGRKERFERAGDGEMFEWATPPRVARVPDDADLLLVCVRYEQLDSAVNGTRDRRAPVVVLTPMLPQDHARLSSAMPGAIVVGMPGVVAYRNDAGAIRYWLPRGAATLVEKRPAVGAEAELVARLERAGIRARRESDVLGRNVATTVSFIPLAMALDVAGGVDAALADGDLVALALDAASEGRELGRAVGNAEAWASTLLRFVGARTLRLGVSLARARAPEAVAYVEQHFGKLHAQNVAMGASIVELAKQRGTRRSAIERLLERLKRKGS
jgi:ketopantoate reductase